MNPRIIGKQHILTVIVILSILLVSAPLFTPLAHAEEETLVSIDRARALIGFEPEHSMAVVAGHKPAA